MADKCDFCGIEKDGIGVYSTDYAPASLSYCDDCVKIPNIRPMYNALHNWIRKGDKFLNEINISQSEPNVYYKGKYMLFSDYVKEYITEEQKEYLFEKEYLSMTWTEYSEKIRKIIKDGC